MTKEKLSVMEKWLSNPINRSKSYESTKKWRKRNPQYADDHYKQNKNMYKQNGVSKYRELKTNSPWIVAYRAIKQRAKQKGLPIDIDAEYIKSIWTDTCPVLGIPLYSAIFESGLSRKESRARPKDNSPTIDRIDPSKGYVKGNVCIMSYRANMIKNCGSIEEHKKIVSFLERIKDHVSISESSVASSYQSLSNNYEYVSPVLKPSNYSC
jgi:hypothetical protein